MSGSSIGKNPAVSRRAFLGGAAAALAAPHDVAGQTAPHGPLRLAVGLLSDIHITDDASCSDFDDGLAL